MICDTQVDVPRISRLVELMFPIDLLIDRWFVTLFGFKGFYVISTMLEHRHGGSRQVIG